MSDQGKKKLKALKRAQKEAARVYRAQLSEVEAPVSATGSVEPVAVDRFLEAYGELINAAVELYRRLDPQDRRHAQVREALAHAQRVATSALTDVDADAEVETDADVEFDISTGPVTSTSLELVRIGTPSSQRLTFNVPAVEPRLPPRRLPDEASLVRYARVRRATHRWPDEATLARYLRERQLPDESTLHRYIRRRRQLYQLYG
jgi:cation transport regulator ChaB